MGIGVSIFLIAAGAILAFAVHVSLSGISVQVVGVILMVAGAIGLITSMILFGGVGRRRGGGSDRYDRYERDRGRDVY